MFYPGKISLPKKRLPGRAASTLVERQLNPLSLSHPARFRPFRLEIVLAITRAACGGHQTLTVANIMGANLKEIGLDSGHMTSELSGLRVGT